MDRRNASAAETGRELGKSDVAVLKAAKSGRISRNPDGTFDIDKVKLEWAQNTSATRGGDHKKRDRGEGGFAEPPTGYASPSMGDPPSKLLAARTVRETYEAQLAKLKFEETRGALINKAGAERAYETAVRLLRDAVLGVPDRLPFPRDQQIQVRDALMSAMADVAKMLQASE